MNHVLVLLVDGQLKSHTSSQPQVPPQAPQPAAILTSTAATSGPTLLQSRFHWSHMLLAVGLLAASGAGTAVLFKVSRADQYSQISFCIHHVHLVLRMMLKSIWLDSYTLNYS